jgi:hypothetical protein
MIAGRGGRDADAAGDSGHWVRYVAQVQAAADEHR